MSFDTTVTLLFTDIEGSTRWWEAHPDAMQRALEEHDDLIAGAVSRHAGRVVKGVGDGVLAVFEDASSAIVAAETLQRAMADAVWPAPVQLSVRVGIHTGACQVRDGDYFGPEVNRAARLTAAAHGGQIIISREAALACGELPEGITLRDLGLVVRGQDNRFRLLETIAQFAHEQLLLHEDEADDAGAAHIAHYRELALSAAPELTGPRQDGWLTRLEADHFNLIAAIDSLPASDRVRLATGLRRYWMGRGRFRDAFRIARDALASEIPAQEQLLASNLAAGMSLWIDLDAQREYAQRARELAFAMDDDREIAIACQVSCSGAQKRGEDEFGVETARTAVDAARRAQDPVVLRETLMFCATRVRSTDEYVAWTTEALQRAQDAGDALIEAGLHNWLANDAIVADDISTARAQIDRAFALSETLGGPSVAMRINLAWVELLEGDLPAARAQATEAHEQARRSGMRGDAAYALLVLACCATAAGEHAGAARLYEDADEELRASSSGSWSEPERSLRDRYQASLPHQGH